ncbi:MAG: sugar ABC transporter ATP-binding protein [Ignavibacteria bacterium]|nr:sugar ABC transporter ATP-binding protein [Ignavibacteria bacterium]
MNNGIANKVIIEAREISKRFSGVLALDKVNLRVYTGKVNALVGENGAGKSTLVNIMSGVYNEYEGDILLHGQKVAFKDTTDARQAGISIIHQELQLVPYLSIAENIFLGHEPLNSMGFIDYKKMYEEASILLRKLEFDTDVLQKVSSLRVGQQQVVEIAKALAFDVRVLIMDEPTSALSESETNVLFKLIRSLTDKGVAIVYITHKMDELTKLADYVTVFRDGCSISESAVQNIKVDDIIKLMVGRDAKDFFVKKEHTKGPVKLHVDAVSLKKAGNNGKYLLKDISFEVKSSEVLGIFGLMGAGRTELFETIFGLHFSASTGNIFVDGKKIKINNPTDAICSGIALIPEDRKSDGLVMEMDIAKNISLASIGNILKGGLLNDKLEQKQSDTFREKMNIKSYSSRQAAVKLSGGNQQKVVLSKWLVTNPKIFLLDEPTRGIDINAKNEIYKLINDLASQGIAIVLVSSELPEILAISDRIITLCDGRLTGEFERKDFSEEKILKAALPKN